MYLDTLMGSVKTVYLYFGTTLLFDFYVTVRARISQT